MGLARKLFHREFLSPNMLRRSRAREVVLQLLYQDDLHPERSLSPDRNFLRSRLHNNAALVEFADSLLSGVRGNREELDAVVSEHANNWSLARMATTDRNVLRLGAFEILYADTPGRVAINEAVELAKRFGTKQSSQFVNGILDGLLSKATGKSSEASSDAEPDSSKEDEQTTSAETSSPETTNPGDLDDANSDD